MAKKQKNNDDKEFQMAKKRYAVCGVSSRAIWMYISAIAKKFQDRAELVGMLDIDPIRFKVCKNVFPEVKDVAEYLVTPENWQDGFDRMLAEQKPDAILVVSQDWKMIWKSSAKSP